MEPGHATAPAPPPLQQHAYAQDRGLDMELEVSDEETVAVLAGFAAAVIGIFLFLARDTILRRRNDYDNSEEYASKKERTYEKYHSSWTDDYEEVGTRKKGRQDAARELSEEASGGRLPDYYGILGVGRDATKPEIKEAFRRLAKEAHPDRVGQKSDKKNDGSDAPDPDITMAEINKAYEVLSDDDLREEYDARMGR
ncbi:MAG: DnaJ domain-containing protein [Nitrosopumilaceae archaeon]|nr:DnaJ domain-containing protein [Nitrosopumilaceae archaeon]